jgi:hypothetical protein
MKEKVLFTYAERQFEGTLLSFSNEKAIILSGTHFIAIPLKDIRLKKTTKTKPIPIKRCTEKMFNEFWDLYPTANNRKVNKEKCLLKYTSFPIEEHKKIIEGLKKLKTTKSWIEGYEPQTTTFLNQKRWESVQETHKKEVKNNDLLKI